MNKKMYEYGYDKLEYFVKRFNYKYVVIDTDSMTLEEVIEECLNIIRNIIIGVNNLGNNSISTIKFLDIIDKE